MKRYITLLAALMLTLSLSGCEKEVAPVIQPEVETEQTTSAVTTIPDGPVGLVPSTEGTTASAETTLPQETTAETIETTSETTTADEYTNGDITVKNGITYIRGVIIVNKTYSLPSDYNPGVDKTAEDAFKKMQSAAASEGLNIYISSGFRSFDYQAGLYKRYADRDGKAAADRYSARAGHSEHQTGLAFDLNSIDDSFANTAEGKWVAENCYKYGFIIRYPKGKEDVTGYMYEPWHIRYLGDDLAKEVYESGKTLEEFFEIKSEYVE